MLNVYDESTILLEDVKLDFKNQENVIRELSKAASLSDPAMKSHQIERIFQDIIKGYLSICRKLYIVAGAGKEEIRMNFKYNHEIHKAWEKYNKDLTAHDCANLLNFIRLQYNNFTLDEIIPFKKQRQFLSLVLPLDLGGFIDLPIKVATGAAGQLGKYGKDITKITAGIEKAENVKKSIDSINTTVKSSKAPFALIRPSIGSLKNMYLNLGLQNGKLGDRGAYIYNLVCDIDEDLQDIAQQCSDRINAFMKDKSPVKEMKTYQLALQYCLENNIQLNKEQLNYLRETYLIESKVGNYFDSDDDTITNYIRQKRSLHPLNKESIDYLNKKYPQAIKELEKQKDRNIQQDDDSSDDIYKDDGYSIIDEKD